MRQFKESYRDLRITSDARVSGSVTGVLSISAGTVQVSGQAHTVRVTGGTVDITGRVETLQVRGGSVSLAEGCCVNGKVLESGPRWVPADGTWMIDDSTQRYEANALGF